MATIISILVSTILVDNYVFAKFLGICPFLGVSSKTETATGMGIAVTFVVVMASAITWVLQYYVLEAFNIQYLQTITFILVIASLVQFVEMAIKKLSPSLYTAMGVFLPLITTNCMVLGVAVLNITQGYNLFDTLINGIGASIGKVLEGVPIALVAAGLMSIAFSGFAGLV